MVACSQWIGDTNPRGLDVAVWYGKSTCRKYVRAVRYKVYVRVVRYKVYVRATVRVYMYIRATLPPLVF